MNILAIESSCDETAAAVVKDGREVLSNVVASQIDIHAKYGGVVPEVAARAHVQVIIPVVEEALNSVIPAEAGIQSKLDWSQIDAIAVTQGPGLVGSLIVGTETARTLAILKNKPLIAVNHLEGHIYANWVGAVSNNQFPMINQTSNPKSQTKNRHSNHSVIPAEATSYVAHSRFASDFKATFDVAGIQTLNKLDSRLCGNDGGGVNTLPNTKEPIFPAICLLVSGGHTMLIKIDKHYSFKVIGSTRDDAAGEAFDKIAALLGLPYPGGPNIAKLAEKASLCHSREGGKPEDKYKFPIIDLTPEPKRNSDGFLEYPEPSLDFSLSGLKTAVLNEVKTAQNKGQSLAKVKPFQADIAASFQKTLVETLIQNSKRAIERYEPKSFILSGGVAANEELREKLKKMCNDLDIKFYMPDLKYCTDNAVMIGAAAYYKQKEFGFTEAKSLTPNPNLKLV